MKNNINNAETFPWKFQVEFDDDNILTCKLYSQLSFYDENEESTAPPATSVGGFKYAPLIKYRRRSLILHSQDASNLLSLYENSAVQKSIIMEPGTYLANTASEEVDLSGVQASLPLGHSKRRKKEKLGFTEGSCVTKSYSEESIFLKDDIGDVNENKSWNKLSSENFPEKDGIKKRTVNLLNIPRKFSNQEYGLKEMAYNNIVNGNSRRSINPQTSLCTLYKQSKASFRNIFAKINNVPSISKKSDSLDEEKHIASELWRHALLAKRLSKSSCSNNSITQNSEANYLRYSPEKYTLLNERKPWKNYKRTIRLRNTVDLLHPSNCSIKDSYTCKSYS